MSGWEENFYLFQGFSIRSEAVLQFRKYFHCSDSTSPKWQHEDIFCSAVNSPVCAQTQRRHTAAGGGVFVFSPHVLHQILSRRQRLITGRLKTRWSLTAPNKVGQSAWVRVRRSKNKTARETQREGERQIQCLMDLVLSRRSGTSMMSAVFAVSARRRFSGFTVRKSHREERERKRKRKRQRVNQQLQIWAVRATTGNLQKISFRLLQSIRFNSDANKETKKTYYSTFVMLLKIQTYSITSPTLTSRQRCSCFLLIKYIFF